MRLRGDELTFTSAGLCPDCKIGQLEASVGLLGTRHCVACSHGFSYLPDGGVERLSPPERMRLGIAGYVIEADVALRVDGVPVAFSFDGEIIIGQNVIAGFLLILVLDDGAWLEFLTKSPVEILE